MNKKTNYQTMYIKPCGKRARNGKLVYLCPEFHEKVKRIISIIGNDGISIHDFVDNVMAEHFERHKEELQQLYYECQLKKMQL